jgi:photosynthetic reaction center cytochrome c subunit
MTPAWKQILPAGCAVAAMLVLGTAQAPAQSAPAPKAKASPKTAEQVYKNIQVLKGIPADQLIPTMQFITASLGVQCDFCHIESAFDKDDKKNKQTARKMMRMMFAIDKDNFDGHRKVTCYSCHRGAHKPVAIPIISEAENQPLPVQEGEREEANTAGLPTADQILRKYLQALGGAAALAKISTRVQEGTLTVGAQHFLVEVFTAAPAKRVSIVQFPNGESVTGFNGHEGWLSAPRRPVHQMSASEADAARIDADLHFPADLNQFFEKLTVQPPEKIADRETYVIQGTRKDLPPVQLYFDEESGLLVRLVRYVETPLGLDPTQVDYADYREANGVKVPFRWTIARPNGRFTIQVERMQQNVLVGDEKFQEPAGRTETDSH